MDRAGVVGSGRSGEQASLTVKPRSHNRGVAIDLHRIFARMVLNDPTINRPAKEDKIMSRTNFVSGARRLLYVALLVIPARHLPAQVPTVAKKPLPNPAELADLAATIRPPAAANKWQQIPWLGDVNDGRTLARKEERPLFLWTVFGEPLDEC